MGFLERNDADQLSSDRLILIPYFAFFLPPSNDEIVAFLKSLQEHSMDSSYFFPIASQAKPALPALFSEFRATNLNPDLVISSAIDTAAVLGESPLGVMKTAGTSEKLESKLMLHV
jgi:hypothetical protein